MSRPARPLAELRDWGRAARDMVAAFASMLRRPFSPGDGDPACNRVPVVILPGVLEPWRYLLPLSTWLATRGHPVHHVARLGWNLSSFDDAAHKVADVLLREELEGAVIVAHSKGGLVGKTVMLRPDVASRIAGMVTVATPFAGSSLGGRLQRLPGARRTPLANLFADSAPVRQLAERRDVNERIVSLAPSWDQVVAPASTRLTGAVVVDLEPGGHFAPMRDQGVWHLIHDHVHTLSNS